MPGDDDLLSLADRRALVAGEHTGDLHRSDAAPTGGNIHSVSEASGGLGYAVGGLEQQTQQLQALHRQAQREGGYRQDIRCFLVCPKRKKLQAAWNLYNQWRDHKFQRVVEPIANQVAAVQAYLNKLQSQDTLGARIESFLSDPVSLIATVVASYATGGAAAGAALGKIIGPNMDLKGAIARTQVLLAKLNLKYAAALHKVPPALPDGFSRPFPRGCYGQCRNQAGESAAGSFQQQGTGPIPRSLLAFMDGVS
ncbi:MAG TPA: hypothetical protein VGF83_05125 [Actinomycetota bacterium]